MIRIFDSSTARTPELRDPDAFDFPLPVFETRLLRLRVSQGEPSVWLFYRDVVWQRFATLEAGARRGVDARASRAFNSTDVQRLCAEVTEGLAR